MKIPTLTENQKATVLGSPEDRARSARSTVTRRRTPRLIHPALALSECAVILRALRRVISPVQRLATVDEQNEFWLTMRMLEISLENELGLDRAGVAAKLGLAFDASGSLAPRAFFKKGVAA